MSGILSFLSGAIKPVAELIDDVHTSDEERLRLKARLMELENELATKLLDYESRLVEAKSSIIGKEATGHSWIQRNWRPVTMLTFLVLVVCDSFEWLVPENHELPIQAWTLLQIGLGGYVVGRSAEKLAPAILEARRRPDDAVG